MYVLQNNFAYNFLQLEALNKRILTCAPQHVLYEMSTKLILFPVFIIIIVNSFLLSVTKYMLISCLDSYKFKIIVSLKTCPCKRLKFALKNGTDF